LIVGVSATSNVTKPTAAAWIWNILAALEEAGLISLGDKGYHETGQRVVTPYMGLKKPQSQKDVNRAHARLRGPGGRVNAQVLDARSGAGSMSASVRICQTVDAATRRRSAGSRRLRCGRET
jgi:hypothetical protein